MVVVPVASDSQTPLGSGQSVETGAPSMTGSSDAQLHSPGMSAGGHGSGRCAKLPGSSETRNL